MWQTPLGFQLSGIYFFGSGERFDTTQGSDLRGNGIGSDRLRPDGSIVPRNSFTQPTRSRADFRLLRNSLGGKGPLVYFAFDLLEQDGEDVGKLPQLERKRRLAALLAEQPTDSPLLYSQHVVGNGQKVLDAIRAGGYGGIVAKWPTARYYSGGRSTAWLGIDAFRRQEFVIIGWRPAEYGRDLVDSLFLGTFENGKLVYRGEVQADLTHELRDDLTGMLAAIGTRKHPRPTGMPGSDMRVARWVQPQLLAMIEFIDVTAEGLLHAPSLKGIRRDQDDSALYLELEDAG